MCAKVGCTKAICHECYVEKVLEKNNYTVADALPATDGGESRVACTKRCHDIVTRLLKSQTVCLAWDTDTPTGEYKGPSD